MKYVAFFAIFSIYVNLSLQFPKLVHCPEDYEPPNPIAESCGVFTCLGPNKIVGVGCSTYECPPGKYLGYIDSNNSAPYPECCGGQLCAD